MTTIKELKKHLEQFPDDMPIYLEKWSDYKLDTYKEGLFLDDIYVDEHDDIPIVLFQMVI